MSRIGLSTQRRILTVLLAAQLLVIGDVSATDLRGRVEARNAGGYVFPKAGVNVVLYRYESGKWVPAKQTKTGSDGIYFLPGVAPGSYGLQINGLNYPVTVTSQAYQDVPEVIVP